MKSICLSFLLLLPLTMLSQYTFKGKINIENKPLEGALIFSDSLILISGSNGEFEFTKSSSETQVIIQYLQQQKEYTLRSNIYNAISWTAEMKIEPVFISNQYPIVQHTTRKEDLSSINLGQDIPILLDQMPSITTTSDAGNGIGYTGIRVRGSDATRVNITINGIPLNDAESQGVFFVNMPDFISSTDRLTIVRGVGSSTNGGGAFGGSVHIETEQPEGLPYVEYSGSFGSFGTLKNSIRFGTGIQNKWFATARLSTIQSDGYIDRATADLNSYFVQVGRKLGTDKQGELKFITFKGKEVTYQAWNGVSEAMLTNNRKHNSFTYENQVDNYEQEHYQLIGNQQISNTIHLQSGLHYTKGQGYYEEFKPNDFLTAYNIEPLEVNGTLIHQSDIVRRRWLDNDFMGIVGQVTIDKKNYLVELGGAWNKYLGDHFGEVIQGQFVPQEYIGQPYYFNDATKTDGNSYSKFTYQFRKEKYTISPYLDIQYRGVKYDFVGLSLDGNGQVQDLPQQSTFRFFNPKIGASIQWNNHQIHALIAKAQKEPNRNDFVDSPANQLPKHEELLDYELGYSYDSNTTSFAVNSYFMNYKNQLVLTGGINDVGAYTRINIPNSYRLGLETEVETQWGKRNQWQMQANATISKNKIQSFTEQLDNFDTGSPQLIEHRNTNLALSPWLVSGLTVAYTPIDLLKLSLLNKYVSEQYLDNTSTSARALDDYFVSNLSINMDISNQISVVKHCDVYVLINNLWNQEYESNGYTFGYISGGQSTYENYYFPQAGTHFLSGLRLKF